MRPPSAERRNDLHLVPCPHCGTPNGLNTSRCWSCEQALQAVEVSGATSSRGLPTAQSAATSRGLPTAQSAAIPLTRHADSADDSTPHAVRNERSVATPEPDEPRAAIDRAFTPLRDATALATRRRRRWVAGGALAASAALGVAGYQIFQAPVGLSVDVAATGSAPTSVGTAAIRQDEAGFAATSATLAPANSRPHETEATHSATVGSVRPVASREPAPVAQRSRAGSTAATRAGRAPAHPPIERSTGDDLATAAEVMPDPAAALGLARRDTTPAAGDASSADRAETTAPPAPAGAKAPRAKPACAIAAAVLGLCRRDPERE